MIRTIRARLGAIGAGAGGNAGNYHFTDGLSDDPRLASYLQDLTPAQLQNALDGNAPSIEDMTGCTPDGAGGVQCPQWTLASCSDPAQYDATICGPGGPGASNPLFMNSFAQKLNLPSVPTWAWVAGAGGLALLILGGARR